MFLYIILILISIYLKFEFYIIYIIYILNFIGYHLLFHGTDDNNALLKSKLYRLYVNMCPALLQGYFIERNKEW